MRKVSWSAVLCVALPCYGAGCAALHPSAREPSTGNAQLDAADATSAAALVTVADSEGSNSGTRRPASRHTTSQKKKSTSKTGISLTAFADERDLEKQTAESSPAKEQSPRQRNIDPVDSFAQQRLPSAPTDPTPQSPAGGGSRTPATGNSGRLSDRLRIPEQLPGTKVQPLTLPPYDPDNPQTREDAIEKLFPNLPEPKLPGKQDGSPMSLADLESLALANHPILRQAMADVGNASGQAYQAGLYPNPVVGYEGDTVGSAGTANYQGIFITQQLKTANKLGLATSAARFDVANAQLNVRKAKVEVLTNVRTAYFDLLVAREAVLIQEALVRFTDQAFRIQVEQLKGGQAAAYEPMQLRVLANQSRASLVQAQNRSEAAWRRLAAAVGIPDLQPVELSGEATNPVPPLQYDAAVSRLLMVNTDLEVARNQAMQSRTHLRLQEVTPIPDVNVYTAIQRDFTDPATRRTTYNLQVGVPLPLFDRNTGNIRSAQSNVVKSAQEPDRVRNQLIGQLADAFERFKNASVLIELYRTRIIPDQSRAYRAIYERHQQEPETVGFGDIVVAQQSLLSSLTTYATALGDRWRALVDILNLLQIDDLRQLQELRAADDTEPLPEMFNNSDRIDSDEIKAAAASADISE